jgi:hypothetical protein
LGEIADSLLYYVICDPDSFTLVCVILIGYLAGHAESSRVERCLRNEPIGEWDSEKTSNKGR